MGTSTREIEMRAAARRCLHALAYDVATFHPPDRVERLVLERAPGLVELVGDRELRAIVAVVSGPLGPS